MGAPPACWVWLHDAWRPAVRMEGNAGLSLVRVLVIGMPPYRLVSPADVRDTNPNAEDQEGADRA
jgi:hypothetical protein